MGGTAADSDKVTFEPFGEGEGGRHLGFWRKSIAGRENSKCKNPEAGKPAVFKEPDVGAGKESMLGQGSTGRGQRGKEGEDRLYGELGIIINVNLMFSYTHSFFSPMNFFPVLLRYN